MPIEIFHLLSYIILKITQYISRGIASLIIVVMLHSHVCAALCASGAYSCCTEKGECCKQDHKSCCDKKEKTEKHSDGCEKDHLTFFSTIGQYHFLKAIDSKIIQPQVAILISKIIKQPIISSEIEFAYTGFHLPPPKDEIIIFIQSFLI